MIEWNTGPSGGDFELPAGEQIVHIEFTRPLSAGWMAVVTRVVT
jgi:hypothetical protein